MWKSLWLLAWLIVLQSVAAEDCEVDLRGLEIECMYYIHKGNPDDPLLNPNDRCCNVIKQANIPCCCNNLNRKVLYPPGATIADLLSWKKVLHCLNYCGRPLPVGTNCGNWVVPPGPPPRD